MAEYYVVRDKNTGLYFRGKGVNRWGKHYNQATIYRIRGTAEHSIKEISWRGEQAEIVPIRIIENPTDLVEVVHGRWLNAQIQAHDPFGYYTHEVDVFTCSVCGVQFDVSECRNYCPNCGAKMRGDTE